MDKVKYFADNCRPNDNYKLSDSGLYLPTSRIDSKVEFYDTETGELLFEPLHNRTVIAGAAITAQKLFGFDTSALDNTPTYNYALGLPTEAEKPTTIRSSYPMTIANNEGSQYYFHDETQRKIRGFCVGTGGAGNDISDVYTEDYCSWITPENIIPFRMPAAIADNVDENIYKGRKNDIDGGSRHAYYFKTFSNTPKLEQNYVSSIGSFSGNITPENVYSGSNAYVGRSFVECHLKIDTGDCREYFRANSGLNKARINQLSLITAWEQEVTVVDKDVNNNTQTKKYKYLQDVRPFSLLNIPTEIISDEEKSISIIYTLYF